MSNGHVEHVFSQLKVTKTNRRACLGENRLDSLLRIATTAPPLSQWNASRAVELWWSDKTRRNVEDTRAPPTKRLHTDTDSNSAGTEHMTYMYIVISPSLHYLGTTSSSNFYRRYMYVSNHPKSTNRPSLCESLACEITFEQCFLTCTNHTSTLHTFMSHLATHYH